MPTINIGNDVTFYYTDSGSPSDFIYPTIVFLHGHTFNGGIFQRLLDLAGPRQLRAIALNRREYPGTTPYSEDERRVIREGSFGERKDFLQEQGILLALAVDGLIQELSLRGPVAVAGWSLGTAFTISLYCSINNLSDNVQHRLKNSIKTFILLDTTNYPLGIPTPPGGYCPLFDDKLSPGQMTSAFGEWAASYYQHGDLSSLDISKLQLSLHGHDLLRQPTIQTMTPTELESLTNTTTQYETLLLGPDFRPALEAQTNTLLFSSQVREAWGKNDFWCLYGEATVWTCIFGSWYLEQRSNGIFFKVLPGANHFFMWDFPEKTVDFLKKICTHESQGNLGDLDF